MKKITAVFIGILVVFSVTVVFVIILLMVKTTKEGSIDVSTKNNTSTLATEKNILNISKQESDTSASEFDGWKNYRNEAFAYSVKYPQNTLIDESDIPKELIFIANDISFYGLIAFRVADKDYLSFYTSITNGTQPSACHERKDLPDLNVLTVKKYVCDSHDGYDPHVVYILLKNGISFEFSLQGTLDNKDAANIFFKAIKSFQVDDIKQ